MDIKWEISEIIRIADWNWRYVQGNAIFFACFLFCIYYLYTKKNKKINALYVYPAVFYTLILANPLIQWVLLEKLGFGARSHRFFWIYQIPFVIAFVIVECFEKIDSKAKKAVFYIAAAAAIVVFGQNMYEEQHYPTENIYKIEDDAIEISKKLHEIDDSETLTIFINDVHLTYTIRQYDPSLLLKLGRYEFQNIAEAADLKKTGERNKNLQWACQMLGYFRGDHSVDENTLGNIFTEKAFDYIILEYEEKNLVEKDYLSMAGRTENYYIYRVNHRAEK